MIPAYLISILILASILIPERASSQDLKNDLYVYFKAFDSITSFSANLKLRIYSFEKNSELLDEMEIQMKKRDDCYYYSIGNEAYLTNESMELIIDHDQQKIIFKKRNTKFLPDPGSQFLPNPDSLLQNYTQIKFKGINNTVKHYQLGHSTSSIRMIDLFIDSTTHLIKQIIYRYANDGFSNGELVKIDFLDMDFEPVFEPGTFSVTQFFILSDGPPKGVNQYQNYDILQVDDY